eukprot:10980926-Alexandrium_andersonii.AAC.1
MAPWGGSGNLVHGSGAHMSKGSASPFLGLSQGKGGKGSHPFDLGGNDGQWVCQERGYWHQNGEVMSCRRCGIQRFRKIPPETEWTPRPW